MTIEDIMFYAATGFVVGLMVILFINLFNI